MLCLYNTSNLTSESLIFFLIENSVSETFSINAALRMKINIVHKRISLVKLQNKNWFLKNWQLLLTINIASNNMTKSLARWKMNVNLARIQSVIIKKNHGVQYGIYLLAVNIMWYCTLKIAISL